MVVRSHRANALLRSEDVHVLIDDLLLTGRAHTSHDAESQFLDAHLDQIVQLIESLDEQELTQHKAIRLLFAHGSRPWEDALK